MGNTKAVVFKQAIRTIVPNIVHLDESFVDVAIQMTTSPNEYGGVGLVLQV